MTKSEFIAQIFIRVASARDAHGDYDTHTINAGTAWKSLIKSAVTDLSEQTWEKKDRDEDVWKLAINERAEILLHAREPYTSGDVPIQWQCELTVDGDYVYDNDFEEESFPLTTAMKKAVELCIKEYFRTIGTL